MPIRFLIISGILVLVLNSCSKPRSICIVTGHDKLLTLAGNDLASYLSKTYPVEQFEVVPEPPSGGRIIHLQISDSLDTSEEFKITGNTNHLFIQGKTPLAVCHGTNSLLKYLGWSFYLSFEVPPVNPEPLDFSQINIENKPLKEKRILFNWHNFISGCTGWDFSQWQDWIDNGSRIGFNTIMVHAYGNNPMHSFSYNGKEKELGYLTTTRRGRDWGAQHVNDVRLLTGGKLFTDSEFGSEAAKVPSEMRNQAATALMQKVFRHASERGLGICFALDVDTWMANPQNIISTLPAESLIKIGGYKTVNPEHPEGKNYYKAQLEKLFTDYPEITILSAWMRKPAQKPGLGSIWLLHDSGSLPEKWRDEYFGIMKKHPQLKDELPYPGLFAIAKIIATFHDILNEIKPGTELALGSWDCDFTEQANPFMPEYCGFIPLDYSYALNQAQVQEKLKAAGEKRNVYPVVWAHHDDHRYIGRPYIPYPEFNSLLNEVNASGYGIIHWTTHPLDLLFTGYENQVWEDTENEPYEKIVENFAGSLLKKNDANLTEYYKEWFLHAPMFGRETTDFFMRPDQEYQLEGYNSSEEVFEKAEQRLTLLQKVNKYALNKQGKMEFRYQAGIEKTIISFFNNHWNGHKVHQLLKNGKRDEALSLAQDLNPEETIRQYAATLSEYGATRGEEGVLISLNLRWLPDYTDLKQRSGLKPVLINFGPTSHDPLAQGAGLKTFFIDKEKNLWLSLGEKELGIPAESNGKIPLQKITDSWLNISTQQEISLKTMRNNNLPPSDYEIKLYFNPQTTGGLVQILSSGGTLAELRLQKGQEILKGIFTTTEGEIKLGIIPEGGIIKIAGIQINTTNSNKPGK